MKFYLAPMEGLTGYIFRQTYEKYFHNIDRYFTPFLASKKLSWKEKNDILPENNQGMEVVPQILTNRADDFVDIAKQVEALGYKEVNLNLGCPSGTVVAKKRGSGMLDDTVELNRFLEAVFEKSPLPVSVKTRIGMEEEYEWEDIEKVYNQYPITELIIHPRLQKDFYKKPLHPEIFGQAVENCRMPLVYNGDINCVEAYETFTKKFPTIDKIMIGRGIFQNPGLIGEIKGETPISKQILKAFHDELLERYAEIMSGDIHTLYRMKEIWAFLGEHFPDSGKILKKMRKANTISQYKIASDEIFRV